MSNLTAAILTLVIISPSIIVLAVIAYRQVREFLIWTEPVRVRTRALARRLWYPQSYQGPLVAAISRSRLWAKTAFLN
jgi:hypothetical protein